MYCIPTESDPNLMESHPPVQSPLSGSATLPAAPVSLSDFNCEFAKLVASLISILKKEDGALELMKDTLDNLVLPASSGGVIHVISSKEYQAAESVQSLFRMLSPYWRSFVDCKLLSTLVEASDCREAIEKLNAFLGKRNDSASGITLQGLQDYILPPAHVHVALERGSHPLTAPAATMPVDSFQPPAYVALEAGSRLPAPPVTTVRVVSSQPRLPVHVKLEANVLTLRDYDRTASAVCRTLQTPRLSLNLCGIRRNCIIIQWEMSADLESYLRTIQLAASDVRALSEAGVTELTVGTFLHLSVPTMDYWELRSSTAVEVRVVVA